MDFDNLEMNEKRELGYDLEALVGRAVKGKSHADLNAAITEALAEVSAEDANRLTLKYSIKGTAADEPAPVWYDPDAIDTDELAEVEPDESRTILYARGAHQNIINMHHGDLIFDPEPVHLDLIRTRVAHVMVSALEADELMRKGLGRFNAEYSTRKPGEVKP